MKFDFEMFLDEKSLPNIFKYRDRNCHTYIPVLAFEFFTQVMTVYGWLLASCYDAIKVAMIMIMTSVLM